MIWLENWNIVGTFARKVTPLFWVAACRSKDLSSWAHWPIFLGTLIEKCVTFESVSHFNQMKCLDSHINRDIEREKRYGRTVYSQCWDKFTRDVFSIKVYHCVDWKQLICPCWFGPMGLRFGEKVNKAASSRPGVCDCSDTPPVWIIQQRSPQRWQLCLEETRKIKNWWRHFSLAPPHRLCSRYCSLFYSMHNRQIKRHL